MSNTCRSVVSDFALGVFAGHSVSPVRPPVCSAGVNVSGGVDTQGVFDFLNAWFVGNPAADFDQQNGLEVSDIFAYLNVWFAGC